MKTQDTTTKNQVSLTESIRAMLSSYSDGQGCPVSLDWARDVEDKTILIDTLPAEVSMIDNNTLYLEVKGQSFEIPVANLVTFALYQGWKDSGYQSYTDLLSLLAAGAVSKLHFNKKSGGGSVVSKIDLDKQWPELASIAGIEINKGRLADKDSNTYYLYINATIMDCMKVLEVAKQVEDLEFIGLSPIQNTDKQAIKFKTNRA